MTQATRCSQSSLAVNVGTQQLPVLLGTHTAISTTNIQQLNETMDTPCAMQEVFVFK